MPSFHTGLKADGLAPGLCRLLLAGGPSNRRALPLLFFPLWPGLRALSRISMAQECGRSWVAGRPLELPPPSGGAMLTVTMFQTFRTFWAFQRQCLTKLSGLLEKSSPRKVWRGDLPRKLLQALGTTALWTRGWSRWGGSGRWVRLCIQRSRCTEMTWLWTAPRRWGAGLARR